MAVTARGISPEQYRAMLAESIKTAGQMLINNAELIVGDMNSRLIGLTIKLDFDPDKGYTPEMTITKSHFPEYQDMEELLKNHDQIIKGDNND